MSKDRAYEKIYLSVIADSNVKTQSVCAFSTYLKGILSLVGAGAFEEFLQHRSEEGYAANDIRFAAIHRIFNDPALWKQRREVMDFFLGCHSTGNSGHYLHAFLANRKFGMAVLKVINDCHGLVPELLSPSLSFSENLLSLPAILFKWISRSPFRSAATAAAIIIFSVLIGFVIRIVAGNQNKWNDALKYKGEAVIELGLRKENGITELSAADRVLSPGDSLVMRFKVPVAGYYSAYYIAIDSKSFRNKPERIGEDSIPSTRQLVPGQETVYVTDIEVAAGDAGSTLILILLVQELPGASDAEERIRKLAFDKETGTMRLDARTLLYYRKLEVAGA